MANEKFIGIVNFIHCGVSCMIGDEYKGKDGDALVEQGLVKKVGDGENSEKPKSKKEKASKE